MAGINDVLSVFQVRAETDDAQKGIAGLGGSFGSLFGTIAGGTAVGGALLGVVTSIGSGMLNLGRSIVGFATDSVRMNASLEQTTLQFETLMGSANKAKEHVGFLYEFAKKTPFETGPIIEASKSLQTFGGAALNTSKNLTLIGDASAATRAPINELGFWVGRLYTSVQAGKPFGEAAMRLQELAVMSPQARSQMEAMQKAGKSAAEVFAVFQGDLGRFTGAMEKQAGTWSGLTSTISDTIGILGGRVFEPFFAAAKLGLKTVADLLGSEGLAKTATQFGQAGMQAFNIVKTAMGPIVPLVTELARAWVGNANAVSTVEGVMKMILRVFAAMLDASAFLVRGLGALVEMYYSIRIAGNALLQGFGKVVEGILWGTQQIAIGLSKVSIGETSKSFERDAAALGDALNKVRADIKGLGEDNAEYERKAKLAVSGSQAVGAAMNKSASEIRRVTEGFQYINPELGKAKFSFDEVSKAIDDQAEATKRSKEETAKLSAESVKDIEELRSKWNELPESKRKNQLAISNLVLQYRSLRDNVTDKSQLPADLERIFLAHEKAAKGADTNTKSAKELAAEKKKLAAEAKKLAEGIEELNSKVMPLEFALERGWFGKINTELPQTVGLTKEMTDELNRMNASTMTMTQAFDKGVFGKVEREITGFQPKIVPVREQFDKMVTSLSELAEIAPGAFGKVSGGIASMLGAAKGGLDAFDTLKKGIQGFGGPNLMSSITSLATGIGGIISVAGVAVNALKSLFAGKPEWQKIGDEIRRDYGIHVSEALAKKIEQDAKALKDRHAAIVLNLSDVIKEMGGVTAQNLEQVIGKTRDLFAMIDSKKITTEQGLKQFQQIFPQLAKVITDSNGIASGSFLELIRLHDRFGMKSKEVTDFVVGQMKTAGEGMMVFLKNAQISNQEAASAMGGAVVAIFDRMRKEGQSTAHALMQLTPLVRELETKLQQAGFSGGAAFDDIRRLAAVAGSEINSKALFAVEGLTQTIKGLHNSGLLTKDMFSGLAGQISATFNDLVRQGMHGDDAMRLMQPTLQTLWEMQRKFGYAVDDTTQTILDQAAAQGHVGQQFMSTSDKMLAATERMTRAIEFMAEKMGYDAAAAADEFGDRTERAAGRAATALDEASNASIGTRERFDDATAAADNFGNTAYGAGRYGASAIGALVPVLGDVRHELQNAEGAFREWASVAGEAAREVQYEVDAVTFGHSPGGIKEWVPRLQQAGDEFEKFAGRTRTATRAAKAGVDEVTAGIGASRDKMAVFGADVTTILGFATRDFATYFRETGEANIDFHNQLKAQLEASKRVEAGLRAQTMTEEQRTQADLLSKYIAFLNEKLSISTQRNTADMEYKKYVGRELTAEERERARVITEIMMKLSADLRSGWESVNAGAKRQVDDLLRHTSQKTTETANQIRFVFKELSGNAQSIGTFMTQTPAQRFEGANWTGASNFAQQVQAQIGALNREYANYQGRPLNAREQEIVRIGGQYMSFLQGKLGLATRMAGLEQERNAFLGRTLSASETARVREIEQAYAGLRAELINGFDEVARVGQQYFGSLEGAVNAVAFGRSPGGLKEWVPLARNAGREFASMTSATIARVRMLGREVDHIGLGSFGAGGFGVGRGGVGTVVIDARGAIIANDAAMQDFTDRIERTIAQRQFSSGERAELVS